MVSDPTSLERMHQLYHLPVIPLPDELSDPDTLYHPNAHFELHTCSPPRSPHHDQCMYTEDSLRLEKTAGLYAASMTHRISLPTYAHPSSPIVLREKLCGGFREGRVTHVWTATRAGETVIAKIFDPLYFIDPYEGTDPFPFVDLSVSREVEAYHRLEPLQGTRVPRFLGLFVSPLPTQGNRTVYVLLLEHVAGQDVRYLVPPPTSDSDPDKVENLCSAHRSAIVDSAVNVFFDILMCGVKQRDMAPRNVIIRPPRHRGDAFCAKEDCPVRFSVDASNVESVMIDFEGSELWDPDHEFYDQQTREREMHSLREDFLEDWWYGKYGI
ncbi:uncharacterized protein BT62DRAFT_939121 [Guyanagaster necrorhizus]|uniref:Protein kinase domain-containing protein n=1 Tax=Guyanagaster necrorhizus TaxID=856835 RepID=A0A9P8ALX7_9AGAR|nr:uncharacterized protein BT62DRAFT_939121 [Guyanagaster necrorhizus MCA 3950]KAG7439297.1 hypothetical protein BT62DRAFT_939121 [Guyanagaster necrorhizus MCA 3950]